MRKQTHWQAMLLPLLLALLLLQPSHAMVLTEVVLSGTQSGEQQTIAAGWKAAAASLNKNSNANIQSNTISVASDSTTIGKSIASAATNALAVFGLYDDDMTLALSTDADFTSSNLVLFGPFTGSGGVRVWSENVYFMSADPMTELVTLLSWALSASAAGAVKFGKVGWMYLTGTAYNGELTTIITKELTNLGFSTPTTYEYPTTSTFTTANFDAFMATNPTCMFLFGARGAHTTAFFTALIQNTFVKTASNGFYIMMPFELMYSTGIAYQSQNAANVVSYNNLRYSAPLPVPTNTSFAASSSFQSDMKAFDASYTSLGTTTGYLMYYGWVYMQQIYYIGNTYNLGGGTNRAAIKKNIFMQNRYNIQDIVLGNYGGVCPSSGKASQLGAACKCNQGGHFITILKVTGTAGQNMGLNVAKDWDSIYPNTPCYPFTAAGSSTTSNIVVNYRNVQSAIVSIQDSTVATSIASQMSTGFSSGADGSTYGSTSPFTLSYTALSATSSTTAAAAVTAAATVSVLSGPVTAPYTPSAMSNYLFVEPITVPLSLTTSTSSNAVYISATAAQQIYTAANFLSTKSKAGSLTGGVHLRYRTDESDLLNQMVGQSLGYYNIPLASTRGVGSTVLISSEIPTSGYTFVVGLQQADLAPLMAFLTAHPQAYIILNFDELTLTYDTITSAFGLSTAEPFMNQVLFATNIPSWTQTGTGSVFEKFVGKLSAAQRTPAAMRAFVAARAVCIANNQTQSSTPQQVLKQWYDATVITVDSLVLGPYIGSAVVFPPSASSNSATNYGARSIAMWSYTRIITPTTNYVADPVTLPLLYATTITTTTTIPEVTSTTETPAKPAATTTSTTTTTTTLSPCSVTTSTTTLPPPKSTTTTTTTSAPSTKSSKSDAWKYVVVAILAGLLIAVVLYAIHLCCTVLPCFGGESFQSAPVDSDAATTVVFVEVEKWSDVQRAVPDAATECTGKYRNLVRRLANKFDCYETGSLNDAFMLVARNPINALKFASALQKEVDGMHGSSVDAVDAAYSSLGFSSGAVRGMRVRVGVHTDVVDIAYDVDTDHYEYRGSGCVAALRTERLAHGGQVLVTGATCEALTEKQLAGVNAVSVGTQSFEEYDEPVPLFEVVGGVHREFGGVQSRPSPLCVGDPALSMCTESAVLCDEDLAEIALTREILSIAFSPLPVKKRITVLRGECQVRGIRVPQRQPRLLDESYAAVLLDLLVQYTFMNSAKTSVPYSGAGMMDADHKGKKIQTSTATGTSQSSAVDETGEGTSIDKLREGDADSSRHNYLVAQKAEAFEDVHSAASD